MREARDKRVVQPREERSCDHMKGRAPNHRCHDSSFLYALEGLDERKYSRLYDGFV